jgi:hypothetical protein
MLRNTPGWYGVRCIIRWPQMTEPSYEESVTVWRAASFGDAIAKAEVAAREYAALCDGEYLELAQAYFIGDAEPITDGTEVFSLIRNSDLEPDDYLTTFFATGDERQGNLGQEAP